MKSEKMDLRARRTRKLLQDAMMSLLQEHDPETISVNDICEKAMVHRTTFYKHYQDKYDLLNQGMSELFQELTKGIPTPEEVIVNVSDSAPPQHFVRMFQHVSENKAFYASMLSSGGGKTFQKLLENYIVDSAGSRIQALTGGKRTLAIPIPILAHFSAGALVHVVTWWLEQKNPPAPIEMAQYMTRLLNNGMIPILRE